MNVRKSRQNMILSLIENESVSTQDELIYKLKEHGYDVTQATISRDIKELKLIKKIGKSGKSVYAVNSHENDVLISKYNAILTESLISTDYAMNTCVIKTHVGMANAACASIDATHWEGVVGTLAGDDTIFVLCRDEQSAKKFSDHLRKMIED